MLRVVGVILLGIGVATIAAPLAAQESGFQRRMIERMCSDDKVMDENRGIDRLSRRLNLTDAQKSTLKDLATASIKSQSDTKATICTDKPDLSTTPARMAFAEKVLENRLEGMKAVQPKLQAFYDGLDDKQKAAFDSGGRVGGIFSFLNHWR
jgi:hypothetical protein